MTSGLVAGEQIVVAVVHSLTAGRTVKMPTSTECQVSRFNLSEWALGHRSFVWFLMLLVVLAGALSSSARPRGRSRLHHQDHDRAGELARRHGGRDDQPGHRPHRTQAAGTRSARFHQELHARPARRRSSSTSRMRRPAARSGRSGCDVRNKINDIKARPADERAGSVLQRPVRRRVRQHLRLHRRWVLLPAAPRLCRGRRGPRS